MKILLIDADSTIPNLAICRLYAYYKAEDVHFQKLNLPYYPGRIKEHVYIDTAEYDKVICSVIFVGNLEYIHGDSIEFGGTGSGDLKKCLPDEIDRMRPDYGLYPENDTSYGFLSRGCIRKCYFCFVPEKEGYIRKAETVDNIVQHRKVKFMDNNFLALPDHMGLLQELVDKKIRCAFNQGLDIRLLTPENSLLLSRLRYLGDYIFAFDDIKSKTLIEGKLPLLAWRKPWQIKFFIYIHPDNPIQDTVERVEWCRENECLPYVMRDISCWDSLYSDFYVDLASWCNQAGLFKKMMFGEFLGKRHPKHPFRVTNSLSLYKRY